MKKLSSTLLLVGLILFGCGEDKSTGPAEPAPARSAYVVNGLAQTLSIFDMEGKTMANDVVQVGKYPNWIVIRGDRAYVVNSGDNSVQVIDLADNATLGLIDTGDGTNPMQIAFLSDNKAYATNYLTDEVVVIDIGAMAVTKRIVVGKAPNTVVVSEGKVYVGNTASAFDGTTVTYGQGTVSVIDGASDEVIETINVGTNPQFAAVDAGGDVHIVCTGDYGAVEGEVYIVDGASDEVVATVAIGGAPGQIAIVSTGIAYLASWSGLLAYSTSDYSVVHASSNPLSEYAGSSGVAADSEGKVYVCVPDWTGGGADKLLVMDSASETLIGSYTPGGGAQLVALR